VASTPDSKPVALVVEDHPDNLLLITAVLRRAGYQAQRAGSAEEALAQLQTRRPDLILMDIQLPGQDGLSLTRQLRQERGMADVPIIALSAHAMQDSRQEAEAAGCDGYITKPIDTRAFPEQLAAILDSRQRRAAGATP